MLDTVSSQDAATDLSQDHAYASSAVLIRSKQRVKSFQSLICLIHIVFAFLQCILPGSSWASSVEDSVSMGTNCSVNKQLVAAKRLPWLLCRLA